MSHKMCYLLGYDQGAVHLLAIQNRRLRVKNIVSGIILIFIPVAYYVVALDSFIFSGFEKVELANMKELYLLFGLLIAALLAPLFSEVGNAKEYAGVAANFLIMFSLPYLVFSLIFSASANENAAILIAILSLLPMPMIIAAKKHLPSL
jgi:hypothetical protein